MTATSKFTTDIKEYFRLYEQKEELANKIKDINALMKAHQEDIQAHMHNNEIPGVEFGKYNLKLRTHKKKSAISEKAIKNCTFFSNTDECARFLESLNQGRSVVESQKLQVFLKV